jgi:PAS domain S-box-containing protein
MAYPVRVLCIDDEPDLLKITKLYLERDGVFAVDTLTSATEAMDRLETTLYDAIVTDYAMPEMDGITFLKALKKIGNTIPVIIFTGRGREEVVIEALNSGADFYLQKGGNPTAQFTELAKKIHYAVSRKRAEVALRASEAEYRLLADNGSDTVWRMRLDGVFTYHSPAVMKLRGYTPYEANKIRMEDSFCLESLAIIRKQFQEEAEKPMSERWSDQILELQMLRKDGSAVWTEVSIRPIRDEVGTVIGLQGSTRDITERKRVIKALQESNKKLSILFGINRQDINRQLSVLTENLRIFQRKQPDIAGDEYLRKVSGAVHNISGLVRFAAQYEQIGVNESVWLECHKLVENAVKQAPLGKVSLINDIPSGKEIFADPLISRVFINLMENAVRYGEKITTIRFTARESGENYLIICEDDGPGIPAKDKTKIFEQGFGKNAGLGLFLTREILAITGINIRETGEPGKGARFEMTVPKGAWRIICSGE